MSSSDSEDERSQGYYQPIAAQPLPGRAGAAGSPAGVNVYTNELFRDENNNADTKPNSGGNGYEMFSAPPGIGSRTMSAMSAAPGKSLAAKRAERMQANLYQPNQSLSRNALGTPPATGSSAWASSPQTQRSASMPSGDADRLQGLRSSYDPNEEAGERNSSQGPNRSRFNQQAQQQQQQQGGVGPVAVPRALQLDLSNMPEFLMTPGPKDAQIQCYIVRDKASTKMYPKYNLFMEDGRRFLLAARKRKSKTSNYLISLDQDDTGRDSETYFGKLRANFVGTEFSVFDHGAKPGQGGRVREELATVMYQYNVLGTRGPRKMTAAISYVDEQGTRLFKPKNPDDVMLDRVKNNHGVEDICIMRNKPPRWNEELNAYCLNFNGRVTEASVKNFQLVSDDSEDHVICQFGKIGKNVFTMDYAWPINALQAFGICLSSFDNKLACE